ncbi:hypothetical protein COCNU_07G012720 [Cocos nucifera]|uniref:26S proteasome non-ATPase regulatory subunit 2 homolog n=1 Tax=Cocos nucifera TaxID=13894 RepID=A0A8K0N4W0_COCNU|nr:hypothetical protein COCNU_07G012720 [Cocos nucifera]
MAVDPSPSSSAGGEQAAPKAPLKDPKKKKDEKKDEDLSEEDLAFKQQLELYVERVQDADPGVQKFALESMSLLLFHVLDFADGFGELSLPMAVDPSPSSSAGGEQAAPKAPLKDPKKKKDEKKDEDLSEEDLAFKQQLELYVERVQDADPGVQKFALESMRNLAGEISQEFAKRQYDDMPIDALMELVQQIVAFHMKHNAEPEAVDLLMEVEDLDLLIEHVDATNYKRACLYLTSSSSYLPSPDDVLALDIAYTIYMKFEDYASALRIALFIDNIQGLVLELDDDIAADDDGEALQDIVNNVKLSEGYLTLARDVEVMEPKSPEDIYKAHLIDGRASASSSLDSARQNLAATFVNAFVNAGFGQDKLMTIPSESTSGGSSGSWLFKNKEHGKASAAASLGMILLWDVDSGLAQIDKYLHSNDNHVVAGALLGVGIVNCGVKNDCDPVNVMDTLSRLSHDTDGDVSMAAIISLGLIGAGTNNARIAGMLRNLSSYYYKEAGHLFCVRIAQGLVHMGKGLLTLSPYHSDRFLLSPMALAGLVTVLHACLDMKSIILGKYHYMLYVLVLAMQVGLDTSNPCLLSISSARNAQRVRSFLSFAAKDANDGGRKSEASLRSGALLGVGIVNCGVKNDCDPALALLIDFVNKEDTIIRIGAILGLGIAYAGSHKDELRARLSLILGDPKTPLEVLVFSAITLGLVYVGSCNEEIAQSIILALMDRSDTELNEQLTRLLPVALGLLYLGKQDSVEATAEVSKTFNEKIRKYCDVTLLSLAYAGTGNVLKVQKLLGICAQHLDKGETHQGPAVLGIALIAMAEELGLDMAIRSLEHLLQYGEQNIRRAVPLALGILCISNPKVNVMDTLSRLSHDTDGDVSMAAIISLGLIGAGTNNARIAGMLRNLSSYYYKEAGHLFCVRIAQGLVHMGKGLLTLSPYHSDRFLLSPMALAGLVTVLHACLDMKSIILGKYHYMLYVLVLAMQPRMLMTVDENLKPLSVPVRVGQAVDVVGQAGRPKTITGFQTHSTPVLLAAGERAELATEKYIPLTSVLEGFVILRENPDYRDDH